MPVFISYMHTGITDYGYYGLPQIEVPGVKVSAHYGGPIVDPVQRPRSAGGHGAGEDVERAAADRIAEIVDANKRFIAATFPHLEPEPFSSQNCLYTRTADHDYIIGPAPGFRAVTLAGGGSGHAFKMGPAIGELCAAAALGEEPPLPVGEKFHVERLLSASGLGVDRAFRK